VSKPGQLGGFISWYRKTRVLGQLRTWSSAIPKDRCTGQPGNDQSAPPKDSILDPPRESVAGKSRKMQRAGKPAASVEGAAGSARSWGNPELRSQRRRRMRDSSRLGNPSPATVKGSCFGVTRNAVADTANGRAVRGDPEVRYRLSRKRQKLGQPGFCIGRLIGTVHDPTKFSHCWDPKDDELCAC